MSEMAAKLGHEGVVYVATGRKYYDEACISVRSLKVSNKLRAAIFTDQPARDTNFDLHIPVKSTGDGFLDKVVNLKRSPFERTLFLDTDTFVCADLSDLFSLLEEFDLAAAHDHLVREVYEVAGVPHAFPEFNTGVLLFKKGPSLQSLLERWGETYREERELFLRMGTGKRFHDQPPFRKAIYGSGLRIATLPPEYNCMYRFAGSVVDAVKIMHCARIGFGWYTYENINSTAELLNCQLSARVFCNGDLLSFSRKTRQLFPNLFDGYELVRIGRLFPRLWQRRFSNLIRRVLGSTARNSGKRTGQ